MKTITLSSSEGMPGNFLEFYHDGRIYYAMGTGEDLKQYKVGGSGDDNEDTLMEYSKKRFSGDL